MVVSYLWASLASAEIPGQGEDVVVMASASAGGDDNVQDDGGGDVAAMAAAYDDGDAATDAIASAGTEGSVMNDPATGNLAVLTSGNATFALATIESVKELQEKLAASIETTRSTILLEAEALRSEAASKVATETEGMKAQLQSLDGAVAERIAAMRETHARLAIETNSGLSNAHGKCCCREDRSTGLACAWMQREQLGRATGNCPGGAAEPPHLGADLAFFQAAMESCAASDGWASARTKSEVGIVGV